MALNPFSSSRSGVDLWDPLSFDRFWDPFESFTSAERSPARSFAREASAIARTKVDWLETPDSHVFKVELPGLKKEEVKVDIEDGNVLKISGERSKEEVKETDKWHRVERSHGQFLRTFRLPKNVHVDQISAGVENGVLTITVPKVPEKKPENRNVDVA
eukprot:TRINITY_DN19784_c0_g1_i1.p1 TRINITY_DN19784_c0_g1~~TRINITY_DN19784_c0_g1_i1.p1  ORF type:complete len:159 (+),score=33.98 TRINITY_DN19784_c0_g1_i1:63-539(+)